MNESTSRESFNIGKDDNDDKLRKECVKNNVLDNNYIIKHRVGRKSKDGEVYKVDYGNEHLAMKNIPLQYNDLEYIKVYNKPKAMVKSVWVELMCMKLSNYLINSKITPNVPQLVKYYRCKQCNYSNKNILKNINNSSQCLHVLTEYAMFGDLQKWCKKSKSEQEWKSMFFQVFNGLYAFQKHFNLTHHDLHWGNVLVHKVPKNTVYEYIIDDKKYIVPMYSLFTIWDFAYANIPRKLEIKDLDFYYEDSTQIPRRCVDYYRISRILQWVNKENINVEIPESITDFVNQIQIEFKNETSLEIIIHKYFTEFLNNETDINTDTDVPITSSFNIDNKLIIPKQYEWLKDSKRNINLFYDNYGKDHIILDLQDNTLKTDKSIIKRLYKKIFLTPKIILSARLT